MSFNWLRFVAAGAVVSLLAHASHAGDGGDAFTYQGQLTQGGDPAVGPLDLSFRLFNAASGGAQIGPTLSSTDFTDFDDAGRFTVELAFGPTAFPGAARWLEITVEGVTLSPRQRINPVPYATRSLDVAQVGSTALSGSYTNALTMTNGANQFGGTFNGTASGTFSGTHSGNGASLTALNASNIANGTLAGAILSGTYGNALTMTNGANQFGGTFNGTLNGTHSGNGASLTALHAGNVTTGTLNPARLPANGNWPLFGPLTVDTATLVVDPTADRVGIGTAAPQQALSLVGGANVDQNNGNTGTLVNTLRFGSFSGEAIGSNRGAGENSFGLDFWAGASKRMSITNDGKIGIGTATPSAVLQVNAAGSGAALAFNTGGLRVARSQFGDWSVIGGHPSNVGIDTVRGGTIAGGGMTDHPNRVLADFGTIGGGTGNTTSGEGAFVGGGRNNTTSGAFALVSGGEENSADGGYASVGGGWANIAADDYATIGGGQLNLTEARSATIGGGSENRAGGFGATVGGGYRNNAAGFQSTVPGGWDNSASGAYSFAAGGRARADHDHSFVWSDGYTTHSTEERQFLIFAGNGVGINTNAPSSTLQVVGGVRALGGAPEPFCCTDRGYSFAMNGGDDDSGMYSSADGQLEFYTNRLERLRIIPNGDVGIGTTTPGAKLEVNGSAAKPGGGLWSVSSDIRLKKDIAPLAHALDDLLRLRGVTYEYIDPAAINELEGTRMGFIAQEVEEVFPDWVDEGSRGFKRLTIRGFEALAVEAIRALRAEKDAQLAERDAQLAERDAQVAVRDAQVAALSRKVEDLESAVRELLRERQERR